MTKTHKINHVDKKRILRFLISSFLLPDMAPLTVDDKHVETEIEI